MARITGVALLGNRVNNVADERERRVFGERVHHRSLRIRYDQHVTRMDGLPSADAGSVESEPFFENTLGQFVYRYGKMLPQPGIIHELEINHHCLALFCQL